MRLHALPICWRAMDDVGLLGAPRLSRAIEISVGFRMLASDSQVVPDFLKAAVAE